MKWVSRVLLVFVLSALPMTGAFAHHVGAAGSELSVLPATGDFFAAHHADAALSTLVVLPPRDTHCTTGNDAAGHDCGHACCTVACGLHCGALPSAFQFSLNVAAACAPSVSTDAEPASLTHAPPVRPPIA